MENYKPSQEELKKTELMMTTEQAKASKNRESLYIQERAKFLDETILDQDKSDTRRAPTPEERESMDGNFQQLGKIFEGSGVRWQLDGALNISLMKGEYIGVHKDVDISIEADDLEKLNDQLGKNGYGLFLTTNNPVDSNKRLMQRVGPQQFQTIRKLQGAPLQIIAIDEEGRVNEGKTLNFIDAHLVKRGADGNPLGHGGIKLPKEWAEPQPMIYQDQEIKLSHPAKVAYFKIHGTRPFDATDTRILAETGKLTIKDVDDVEQVFEQEFVMRHKNADDILNRVADKITKKSSANEIYNAFVGEPMIAQKIQHDEQIKEILTDLANKISETDKSVEQVRQLSFQIFNIEKSFDVERKKVNDLRNLVSQNAKLKEMRSSLGLDN